MIAMTGTRASDFVKGGKMLTLEKVMAELAGSGLLILLVCPQVEVFLERSLVVAAEACGFEHGGVTEIFGKE